MATTDYHDYPYPEGTSAPYVNLDIQALAERVDKDIPVIVNTIAERNALPTLLNLKVLVKALDYQMYVWDGASWVFGTSAAGGIVNGFSNITVSPGLGASSVMCDAVQCDLVAGRWYKATYTVTTVTPDVNAAIAWAINKSPVSDLTAGGTVLQDGTQRYFYTAPVANNSKTDIIMTKWKATATETVNIKAVMARATGTNTYTINSRAILVEDIGRV